MVNYYQGHSLGSHFPDIDTKLVCPFWAQYNHYSSQPTYQDASKVSVYDIKLNFYIYGLLNFLLSPVVSYSQTISNLLCYASADLLFLCDKT